MSKFKKIQMISMSLVLAGILLFAALGMVSAAGTWQAVGIDGGRIFDLILAQTEGVSIQNY